MTDEQIYDLASDSFNRKGVTVKDRDILKAISHTLSKKIIPGGVSEKNIDSNKNLLSDEDFSELYTSIKDIIEQISLDMLTGNISSRAFVKEGSDIPDCKKTCAYCDSRDICRRNNAIADKDDINDNKT